MPLDTKVHACSMQCGIIQPVLALAHLGKPPGMASSQAGSIQPQLLAARIATSMNGRILYITKIRKYALILMLTLPGFLATPSSA